MTLPKIFTPDIAASASYSLDVTGDIFFTGGAAGGYGILVKEEYPRGYVLGLLNSKLLEWYIKQTATQMRGGYFSFESRFIKDLPIWSDFTDSKEKHLRDSLVELVSNLLDLQKRSSDSKAPHEQKTLLRQIETVDSGIDDLVFELYGITEMEVNIIKQCS